MSRAALSASRSIAILNFLAAHPTDGFTLSELAKKLDINISSCHAALAVLTDAAYLVRHSRLRTYTLGPSAVALGSAALESHEAIDIARDAARQLADELELEVSVTAPAGNDIVFLARTGHHRARGIAMHVGQRVPLVAPLGSVFVAWHGADRWLDQASDRTAMQAVLRDVRRRGYTVALEADARRGLGEALDRLADDPNDPDVRLAIRDHVDELARQTFQIGDLDPTVTYDVSGIAAPIFDADANVILALTLVGFEPALSAARINTYGEQLRDACLVVTKRTRGSLPAVPPHRNKDRP